MRLKELREEKGMTQRQLAVAIGCSPCNYARYERGVREPDISTLKLLSKCLETSIDDIVGNKYCFS